MFAFHHPRPRCVASHASAHDANSGSPKSAGTSRATPRMSGQVSAIVTTAYSAVAVGAVTPDPGAWIRRRCESRSPTPDAPPGSTLLDALNPDFLAGGDLVDDD